MVSWLGGQVKVKISKVFWQELDIIIGWTQNLYTLHLQMSLVCYWNLLVVPKELLPEGIGPRRICSSGEKNQ